MLWCVQPSIMIPKVFANSPAIFVSTASISESISATGEFRDIFSKLVFERVNSDSQEENSKFSIRIQSIDLYPRLAFCKILGWGNILLTSFLQFGCCKWICDCELYNLFHELVFSSSHFCISTCLNYHVLWWNRSLQYDRPCQSMYHVITYHAAFNVCPYSAVVHLDSLICLTCWCKPDVTPKR